MSYRFKTEEEFEKEYGPNWRNVVGEHWASPHMDELFGKDVPSHITPENISTETVNTSLVDGWCISMDMITTKPSKQLAPSYEPKKIDRRLMENHKSIKDLRIYCETREASLSLEDFLHRTGWVWSDGAKYHIRNDGSIDGVVINDFNFDKKVFSGTRARNKPTNVDDMYDYTKDILTIRRFFVKEPNYLPKKIDKNIDSLEENKQYLCQDDLLLEKSSLTKLGVPREVMQPLQKDFAISPDAEWERVRLKREAEKIIRTGEKEFLLQLEIDSVKVFVAYSISGIDRYFIDSYVMDESGWGAYEKLPREEVSVTQLLYQVNSRAILYHLKSPFSIVRQPKRKLIKKEKSFVEFTENFKKDFLKNFDSILKRIVGSKYKDAKKEIQDKARQMEMENKMMLSGLDDPLEGPNSITLLDQFITEFEEAYSDFFGERLDIEELSKHFTREKMMTSFMYFIYAGRILDK